jgi:hypothetical protein
MRHNSYKWEYLAVHLLKLMWMTVDISVQYYVINIILNHKDVSTIFFYLGGDFFYDPGNNIWFQSKMNGYNNNVFSQNPRGPRDYSWAL